MSTWQQLGVNPIDYGFDPDDSDEREHYCERCDKPLPTQPTGEFMVKVGVKSWERVEGYGDVPAEFEWEPRPEWCCENCGHVNT